MVRRIKKMRPIHTIADNSALKRKEILPCTACLYHTLFIPEIILLNAFFFIYIHMGFIYGENVLSSLFPSCTDTCLLAHLKFI